jgi:hypothetical protein
MIRSLNHAIHIARDGHFGPIRLEATLNAVPFYERFGFRALERIHVQRVGYCAMYLDGAKSHVTTLKFRFESGCSLLIVILMDQL